MPESLEAQDIVVTLETVDWVPARPEERDGITLHPGMWSVFFKVDGTTARISNDPGTQGTVIGTATVRGTTGTGLGVGDFVAGRSLPIPPEIGRWTDRIVPLPFGELSLPALFGVGLVVFDPGVLGTDALEAGHATLAAALQKGLDDLLPTLPPLQPPTDEQIADLVKAVSAAVRTAVEFTFDVVVDPVVNALTGPWFHAAFGTFTQNDLPGDPLAQLDFEEGFLFTDRTPTASIGDQHFCGVTGAVAREMRNVGTGVLSRFDRAVRGVAGFSDDAFQHVAVATDDGAVTELWWPGGGSVSRGGLAHFDAGVVALAGFYSRDGVKHVIVATEDHELTELWWQAGDVSRSSLGTASGPVVALAGYQAGEGTQHVIVATADGVVTELWWQGGGAVGQNLLTRVDGRIVDVAGYWSADGFQHVIVGSGDRDLTELWWQGSSSVSSGPLTRLDSDGTPVPVLGREGWKHMLGLGAYFAPRGHRDAGIETESEQHVIVGLSNGALREVRWTPGDAGVRHDDLGVVPGLQPHDLDARIGPLVDAYVDAGGIQHAIVTTSDRAVHELWWAPVPPVFLGGVLATG